MRHEPVDCSTWRELVCAWSTKGARSPSRPRQRPAPQATRRPGRCSQHCPGLAAPATSTASPRPPHPPGSRRRQSGSARRRCRPGCMRTRTRPCQSPRGAGPTPATPHTRSRWPGPAGGRVAGAAERVGVSRTRGPTPPCSPATCSSSHAYDPDAQTCRRPQQALRTPHLEVVEQRVPARQVTCIGKGDRRWSLHQAGRGVW